jgi:hypothetical protein
LLTPADEAVGPDQHHARGVDAVQVEESASGVDQIRRGAAADLADLERNPILPPDRRGRLAPGIAVRAG